MNIRTKKGTRFLLLHGQRSAGRHLVGPVFASTEWHSYPKYSRVRYFNLTIGNPKKHYRWAFSAWLYITL